jgi:hypothetical protein
MVHGAWCMVHGAWCMVHGAWCMVHGAWCMVTYTMQFRLFPVHSSHSDCHCCTNESGATTRKGPLVATRGFSLWRSCSMKPIVCIVLPSPISSARMDGRLLYLGDRLQRMYYGGSFTTDVLWWSVTTHVL